MENNVEITPEIEEAVYKTTETLEEYQKEITKIKLTGTVTMEVLMLII
jgi:ribosome-associated translation inhibitor RaiA